MRSFLMYVVLLALGGCSTGTKPANTADSSDSSNPSNTESNGDLVTGTGKEEGGALLGSFSAPSGKLLIIDGGYLGLWQHDQTPWMPDGYGVSAEGMKKANSSVDLKIDGPDAKEAGRIWDRQWHPEYIFDLPLERVKPMEADLKKICQERNLTAGLVVLPKRVSHRQRIDLAIEHGGGAGVVQYHGIWAVAIGGVPRNREISVRAHPLEDGDYAGRWKQVEFVLQEGDVADSQEIGQVMVDYARLFFADADALGQWKHEEPLDGKADYVFWGPNAPQVAQAVKAPNVGEGDFGWTDQPIDEAVEKGRRVEELCEKEGIKLGRDFRPHSHHYQLMKVLRASENDSGEVVIGGAKILGWMTTWGDGLFPVFLDRSADGKLLRVRIELGTAERMKLMDEVWERATGEKSGD